MWVLCTYNRVYVNYYTPQLWTLTIIVLVGKCTVMVIIINYKINGFRSLLILTLFIKYF